MKTYQQEGFELRLKPMMESGNVCQCCDKYDHEAELGSDDYECKVCGMLCSCKCHANDKPSEEPPAPAPEPVVEKKPKAKAKAKKKAAKKRPAK